MASISEQEHMMEELETKPYLANSFPSVGIWMSQAIAQGLHPGLAAVSWLHAAINTAFSTGSQIGLPVENDWGTQIMRGYLIDDKIPVLGISELLNALRMVKNEMMECIRVEQLKGGEDPVQTQKTTEPKPPIQDSNKNNSDSDLELTLERDRSARLQRTIDEQRSALNAHVAEIERLRAELARGHEANTKLALQMQELKNSRDGRMRAAHELIGAITLDAHLARNE